MPGLEEVTFLRRLLLIFYFFLYDLPFPLGNFSSSLQPLLLLAFSIVVLCHRQYCCLKVLMNCFENENTGPSDLHLLRACFAFWDALYSPMLILLSLSTHKVFLLLHPSWAISSKNIFCWNLLWMSICWSRGAKFLHLMGIDVRWPFGVNL